MLLVCRGKLSPPFSTYRSARLRSSFAILRADERLLSCMYHSQFTEKSPFRIAVAMRIVLAEAGLLLRLVVALRKSWWLSLEFRWGSHLHLGIHGQVACPTYLRRISILTHLGQPYVFFLSPVVGESTQKPAWSRLIASKASQPYECL